MALDIDCTEFCRRFGWSPDKFRKVAQRARARLRALVVEYDQGERCQRLAGDLDAYVARVAADEQAERVRRHLANCRACAHTARELDLVARGVAAALPVSPVVDAETVHRVGAVGRALGRLLPFGDDAETAAAAKAGAAGAAAAAGGGGASSIGAALGSAGAAKLGLVAVCVAGAAGGYAVCDQVGLFTGPLPREGRPAASGRAGESTSPSAASSSAPARAPAPVARVVRALATGESRRSTRNRSVTSAGSSTPGSSEFGFEADARSSGPAPPRPSPPSAHAASNAAPSEGRSASSRGPGSKAAREFGFE